MNTDTVNKINFWDISPTEKLKGKHLKVLLQQNQERVDNAIADRLIPRGKVESWLNLASEEESDISLYELLNEEIIIKKITYKGSSNTSNKVNQKIVIEKLFHGFSTASGTNSVSRIEQEKYRNIEKGHYMGTLKAQESFKDKVQHLVSIHATTERNAMMQMVDEFVDMVKNTNGRSYAYDLPNMKLLNEMIEYILNERPDVVDVLEEFGYDIQKLTGDMKEYQKEATLKNAGFRTLLTSNIFQRGSEAKQPFAAPSNEAVYSMIKGDIKKNLGISLTPKMNKELFDIVKILFDSETYLDSKARTQAINDLDQLMEFIVNNRYLIQNMDRVFVNEFFKKFKESARIGELFEFSDFLTEASLKNGDIARGFQSLFTSLSSQEALSDVEKEIMRLVAPI